MVRYKSYRVTFAFVVYMTKWHNCVPKDVYTRGILCTRAPWPIP